MKRLKDYRRKISLKEFNYKDNDYRPTDEEKEYFKQLREHAKYTVHKRR